MTTIENQYAYFFSLLGYTIEFYPEKQLFYLKEPNVYCKLCADPTPEEIIKQAEEYSNKYSIILLSGPLSFKSYCLYFKGGGIVEGFFVEEQCKYSPIYWQPEYILDLFNESDVATALAIRNGEDVVCHRCGLINEFTISKPSIHYKATCKCGAYITNISENKPSYFFFGKYKDRSVKSMSTTEEIQYLQWGINQNIFKGKLKKDVMERLSEV